MIVQAFYRDYLKEFYFQDVIDGRHQIVFYSYEVGLDWDIEFFLEINNGIKHIGGKNIVADNTGRFDENGILVEDNRLVSVKLRSTGESVGVLVFDTNPDIIRFKKYLVRKQYIEVGANGDIEYDSSNHLGRYFAISYEDSKTYIIPFINRIYLDGRLIREKTRIRFGKVVSYNMFKFIYLGNVIAINNPGGVVRCNFDEYHYRPISDVRGMDSYAVDQPEVQSTFTRSPRITHKPIEEVMEIDPPTNKKDPKEKPLILTIGPSFTMSFAMIINVIFMIKANSSGRSPIPSAIMALCMLAGAVVWPIIIRKHNKKQVEEEEQLRIEKYRQYINDTDLKLEEKSKYNRRVYEELYPSLESLVRSALNTERSLWDHTPNEEGFLDVRIGRGIRKFSVAINIQKERFSLEDDPLKKYASMLQNKYKYLNNVPISVDLNRANVVGVVGSRAKQIDLLKLIMIRLAITHCYDEVKLALLYNQRDEQQWEFAKWLPHCWDDNKTRRFIADNTDGAYVVMSRLREIYNERESLNKDAVCLPHYIVFITDYNLISRDSGMVKFIESAAPLGFTFVLGYDSIGSLPNNCKTIIQVSEQECTIYDKADNSGKMASFVPDIYQGTDGKKIAGCLAGIKINKVADEKMVPDRLSFFGLYKAKNIEDLVIDKRWAQSQSHKSLEAPIGMGSNDEVFSLNIHEKYHGPHGLIAGTTGSGKSEFIQSLILSMAINYHPYDVSFVLIDYKGGGMANAFEGLPHVSGTITNLEGSQIKRSLISLKSELKRRQAIFKEYGVNHIDSYQIKYKKSLASEPLPHLVIVSDEFAELKSQEPEFMSELISTARIGRSLGVHLILATQKPSGVVNDQIWSNTRFRICLKVADRSDSKEMLKRDDAASITLPGRCYVQVGNDEIFRLVQSGYSGEKYIRDGSNLSDNSVSVACIDLQGTEMYKTSQKVNEVDTDETQLSAIVKYISAYSASLGVNPLKLWLPPLPNELFLDDLDKRQGGFDGNRWIPCNDWLNPIIGLYDEPERQHQDVLSIDFGINGHFLLYGAPGTGKTTFLHTLMYSLCRRYSPDIINMYVLDFGGRSLSFCNMLPHVADIMFSDDDDKIKKLFQRIDGELSARKKMLAEYGVGNLLSYMQASGRTVPAIMVIIDNYAAFFELFSKYENDLIRLSREGGNYGIYLIITSASVNAVKRRISENVKTAFTLQLNDSYDYAAVMGRTEGVFPDNVKGRGLVRLDSVLEYQTALAVRAESESERVRILKEIFTDMAEKWTGELPKPLPVLPESMELDSVMLTPEYSSALRAGLVPVGYDVENIELINYDINENHIFSIIGDLGSGKSTFVTTMIRLNADREIWLVDNGAGSLKKAPGVGDIPHYCTAAEGIEEFIKELFYEVLRRYKEYTQYCEEKGQVSRREFMKQYKDIVLVIDDFNLFFDKISNIGLSYFKKIVEETTNEIGVRLFVSISSNLIGKYRSQFRQIFEAPYAMVLGNIDNLALLNINVPYAVKKDIKPEPGRGYYVQNGAYTIVKTPFIG